MYYSTVGNPPYASVDNGEKLLLKKKKELKNSRAFS